MDLLNKSSGTQNERAGEMRIESETDIVVARRRLRELTREIGFNITDVTRVVTAASELTRNMYQYAAAGTIRWRVLDEGGRQGVELVFEDQGPGIEGLAQVMEDGYSSAGGLGVGLPGSRRLVDEMDVESTPGEGTVITIRKWLRRERG